MVHMDTGEGLVRGVSSVSLKNFYVYTIVGKRIIGSCRRVMSVLFMVLGIEPDTRR